MKWKDRLFEDILEEIRKREGEGENLIFQTIYIGGGTPSVLSPEQVQIILDTLNEYYLIGEEPEISFEANPDDLTDDYLRALRENTSVNRLSIGIQAFQDKFLKLLNRRHTGNESIRCIERSLKFGFEDLNLDLIYGIPGMSLDEWKDNLDQIDRFHISHLSAYHLSFEPKTVLTNFLKKGKIKVVEEEVSIAQYDLLMDFAVAKSYDNYEISNFARNGRYSKHNLGYWTGKYYLGFGPSAHSFNGEKRRWNHSNNSLYMNEIENGSDNYFEAELIDNRKAFNEYLLTALRTKWGIDLDFIQEKFGSELKESCMKNIHAFGSNEIFVDNGKKYTLSRKGKFISDYVISKLMV